MDRLTEVLIAARDAAVEERAREHGPTYMSTLEGYGDMMRKLHKTPGSPYSYVLQEHCIPEDTRCLQE